MSDPATVAPQILRPGGTQPRGWSLCADFGNLMAPLPIRRWVPNRKICCADAIRRLNATVPAGFLSAYRAGGLLVQELQYLDALRRFREGIQGTYFAWPLATNDLTGGIDQAENEKGLNDARRRLGALGLDTT